MKFNLERVFLDKDDKAITNGQKFYISEILKLLISYKIEIPEELAELAKETKAVTLGEVIYEAATNITSIDKQMSGADKYAFYKLTKKLGEPEVELEAEEITKIKDAIGKCYPNVLLVGQAWDILEGK